MIKKRIFVVILMGVITLAVGCNKTKEKINTSEGNVEQTTNVENKTVSENTEANKNVGQIEDVEKNKNKENNLKKKQLEVQDYAKEGYKSFKEADFKNSDYEGYNNPEAFAIGFRNALLQNADKKLDLVKKNSIVCVVNSMKIEETKIQNNEAQVNLIAQVALTENKITKNQSLKVKMTLIKSGDIWLVNSIEE